MSARPQYLLDTNVLCETRKKQADERVILFLSATAPAILYISVLTLGELRKGVALKKRSDPDSAKRIAAWVDGLEFSFADRIFGIDGHCQICGEYGLHSAPGRLLTLFWPRLPLCTS